MTRLASVEQFAADVGRVAQTFNEYPDKAAELDAIAAALASDETTRDITLETPVPLNAGAGNSPFTNAVLLLVNKGKAANLTPAEMSEALTGVGAEPPATEPPVLVNAPAVYGEAGTAVGDTLTCTMGEWQNVPTSYAYQWMRSGTEISGVTTNTYLLGAIDSGESLSCVLTATNAAGSAIEESNAVAIE